ncbi:hypothetical protein AWB83_05340 [Caballeronia ptereochthonis]|uniref:Uncharacterized protein n=1 Tax=Caballeronia ptereochthonis TaxID=1777144 RepID=A0A158DED6_9BURK|nr:hypothetical protein AWB83_05340 [Caballeronia ptereochthonis]
MRGECFIFQRTEKQGARLMVILCFTGMRPFRWIIPMFEERRLS